MLEAGAKYGWRPPHVYRATIQEMIATERGWLRAQGIDPDEKKMSVKDTDDLIKQFHQIRAERGLPPIEA